MNKATSLYLDLTRFLAAVVVLFYHFAYERFSGGDLMFIRETKIGSDAVILFFVLSGYVIAYVSAERDKNLKKYALSRMSRLWSVVIPALVMTIIVDQLGSSINPQAYDGWWYQSDSPVVRFFAGALFANELWFKSIRPFSNGPFWSLGYEFWYYAIFAAAFYFTGKVRILLVTAALLIAGPKILLLFPIWLMGAWTYYFNQRQKISIAQGWLLFVLPFVLYVGVKVLGLDKLAMEFTKALFNTDNAFSLLGFSDEFLISYLYGVLFVMNFIGIYAVAPYVEKYLSVFEKPIRYWAGLTFSIYLLHYPLLTFFSAVYSPEISLWMRNLLILLSTTGMIIIVGNVTEKKKHVLHWLLEGFLRPKQA